MPYFCVNKNDQANGDHEVHQTSPRPCEWLPNPENRISLGEHLSCVGAVAEARRRYPGNRINGCYFCSNECHTT